MLDFIPMFVIALQHNAVVHDVIIYYAIKKKNYIGMNINLVSDK